MILRQKRKPPEVIWGLFARFLPARHVRSAKGRRASRCLLSGIAVSAPPNRKTSRAHASQSLIRSCRLQSLVAMNFDFPKTTTPGFPPGVASQIGVVRRLYFMRPRIASIPTDPFFYQSQVSHWRVPPSASKTTCPLFADR